MHNHLIKLNSLKETNRFAKLISKHLFTGSILMLRGKMGSGKTTFTKSLCSGLGIKPEKVTSPTYTLVNIYTGLFTVFHVDLFRLNSFKELEDFDRQDLINDEGVTIIEWPKLILNYLSNEPILNLNFETFSHHGRKLKLESHSTEFEKLFKALEKESLSLTS